MLKNNKKGFSLVELIVVIAIMAVLMAILVPSLLRNVERSRMQRDDSAMSEVVESVKLALCDFDTYDEAYEYAAEGNYLTYTDSSGVYGQRMMDEERWTPDGSGKCLTITFNPDENGTYDIAKCRINDMGGTTATLVNQCDFEEMGTEHRLFYNMKQVIGPTLQNISATYRHSSYTVFVVFDGPTSVYGQWNGTNLDDNSSDDTPDVPSGHTHVPTQSHDPDCPYDSFHNKDSSAPYCGAIVCAECGKTLSITGNGYETVDTPPVVQHSHCVDPDCTLSHDIVFCPDCGGVVLEHKSHTHTQTAIDIGATCTDAGSHTVICSECGETLEHTTYPPKGHDYQQTDFIPAGPGTEGLKTYTCSNCGATRSERIPAEPLGPSEEEHTHTQVAYDISATCTEHGSHTVECSECGEQLSYNITPPLGHNYEISNISTGPNGEELVTYVCTRCSASYVDTFPAIDSETTCPAAMDGFHMWEDGRCVYCGETK